MSASVVCLLCRRLGVTCARCVVAETFEREHETRVIEGVTYYPFLVRFTLADGKRRRIVRWSPGDPWVRDEIGRELVERYGLEGIKERSVTIRPMAVRS